MIRRIALLLVAIAAAGCNPKKTGEMPGGDASDTLKLGQTMPYSGPASAYGVIGRADTAYFKMVNDKGGINGRKIELLSVDDGYNPSKTVEQTRKLVESDGVLAIFGTMGTPANSAIVGYLNEKKVPQLFIASGADKWADPTHPWTLSWQPSCRTEAKIYARYLEDAKPAAKVCVLFQNDDFGKDYLAGLKDGYRDQYDARVIKAASYEVTDPTIDSQIVTLQASGCDVLVIAATVKFAAQAIRKVHDIGWKPLQLLPNVSASISAVLKPAGLDKSTGVVSGQFLKDPSDPKMADDPGMNDYKAFMKRYLPDVDPTDSNAVYGYGQSATMAATLEQAGADVSRANLMKQALSLDRPSVPVLLPGIELHTAPGDLRPLSQLQLARFNGTSFERFGAVLTAD